MSASHTTKPVSTHASQSWKIGTPVYELPVPVQILIILQHLVRQLFGISTYNRCGYFIDSGMSKIVSEYANSTEYAEGDRVLTGHKHTVMCMVVSTDGRYLYTGGLDNTIIHWDLSDDELLYQWRAHFDLVRCMDYHNKCGLLVTGSHDRSVRLWNAKSHSLIESFEGHTDYVYCVKFDPSGEYIISGSTDVTLRMWSIETGLAVRVVQYSFQWVKCVHFMSNSTNNILVCNGARPIQQWDLELGKCTDTLSFHLDIQDMYVNCDRSLIACIGSNTLVIYLWQDRKMLGRHEQAECLTGCFHPSNPIVLALASSSFPYSIYLMDVLIGQRMISFRKQSMLCRQLCFTPNGDRLIFTDNDNLYCWDIAKLPI